MPAPAVLTKARIQLFCLCVCACIFATTQSPSSPSSPSSPCASPLAWHAPLSPRPPPQALDAACPVPALVASDSQALAQAVLLLACPPAAQPALEWVSRAAAQLSAQQALASVCPVDLAALQAAASLTSLVPGSLPVTP